MATTSLLSGARTYNENQQNLVAGNKHQESIINLFVRVHEEFGFHEALKLSYECAL